MHIPPLAIPFPSLTNCLHPFLPIPPLPIHFYPYYSSYPATLFTTSLPCHNTACSDLVRFIPVPLCSIPFRSVSFCSVLISFYLVSFPSVLYCSVLFRFVYISSTFFYFILFLFFVLYLYILHFRHVKKYKKMRHDKVIL